MPDAVGKNQARSKLMPDSWSAGPSYEHFMGRWSRLTAAAFIDWLAPPPHLRWLELGCGTGALSEIILARAAPASLLGIDPSEAFIQFARQKFQDSRAAFLVGNAQTLPAQPQPFDLAVSGLALNFIDDPVAALQALRGVLWPDGALAFYVWDYAGKMDMLRYFWDSVAALDPGARDLDEGVRFPICAPGALEAICRQAGFDQVAVDAIDTPTAFHDFEDFWSPFLEGQGPAPGYVARLEAPGRKALEDHLRAALPIRPDGSIHLVARAWAVQAIR